MSGGGVVCAATSIAAGCAATGVAPTSVPSASSANTAAIKPAEMMWRFMTLPSFLPRPRVPPGIVVLRNVWRNFQCLLYQYDQTRACVAPARGLLQHDGPEGHQANEAQGGYQQDRVGAEQRVERVEQRQDAAPE